MIPAVVITYKNPDFMRRCLSSLHEQAICYVEDNTPPQQNRLYTVAANDGIKYCLDLLRPIPEFILICCDDVIVHGGAVAALEKFLRENSDCAIACPIQLGTKGEVTCGGCTAAFPYGRHVTEPLTHELYLKPYESFWANGACFLVRTAAIRDCGLMDENMRFICSDADWSFTMRARGWKVFMVPEARVTHEPNGALQTKNAFLEKVKDADALHFIKKWLSGGLYQEISAEGMRLKAEDIQGQLNILNWRLAHGYAEVQTEISREEAQCPSKVKRKDGNSANS